MRRSNIVVARDPFEQMPYQSMAQRLRSLAKLADMSHQLSNMAMTLESVGAKHDACHLLDLANRIDYALGKMTLPEIDLNNQ